MANWTAHFPGSASGRYTITSLREEFKRFVGLTFVSKIIPTQPSFPPSDKIQVPVTSLSQACVFSSFLVMIFLYGIPVVRRMESGANTALKQMVHIIFWSVISDFTMLGPRSDDCCSCTRISIPHRDIKEKKVNQPVPIPGHVMWSCSLYATS